MRIVSLFSGIEGFGLGLQLALGAEAEIVLQVEIDPFASRILEARYPNVPRISDVREVDAGAPRGDVLAAGFPCQPVSQAGPNNTRGAQAYSDDPRWLWPQVIRIIRETRPPLVLLENVRGLLRAGMRDVVTDLASVGYAAQWDLVPAAAVGAPHLRHRIWVVAYPEETPLGRVFSRTPPVFAWPDEREAMPRLARGVPHRRQRLSALGNAVVPQVVAYLALELVRARGEEPLIPAGLFGVDPATGWDGSYPVAGALLGGMLYEEATVTPMIEGRRWPTPTTSTNRRGREALIAKQWSRPGLEQMVELSQGILPREFETPDELKGEAAMLWPSPASRDSKGPSGAGFLERRAGGPDLAAAAMLYPTPSASDATGGRISSEEVRETGRRPSGAKAQRSLADAANEAEKIWPTPKASPSGPDYARAGRDGSGGDDLATAVARDESGEAKATALNPRWVEWLMGYPAEWTNPEVGGE